MYFSPKTSADGLVFHYDTGNTVRSYLGEPTVNLLPNGVAATHDAASGNAVTVTDATNEKGPGWKKVTITTRGTNFRTLQWSYITMSANTTYCHSAVLDWGNMRGKNYFIYFDGSGTGTRTYYYPGNYTTPVVSNIDSSMPDGKFAGIITHTAEHTHAFFIGNYTTSVSGLNDYFYYKELQVEVKSHPTQFTTGTRSATQGLKDLTAANTINLSNVSFDANAQKVFDGSNDYISLADGTRWFTNEWSYEMVLKFNGNTGTYQGLLWGEGDTGGGSGLQKLFSFYNYSYFHYRINNVVTGWAQTDFTPTGFTPTKYNHLVWQFNNGVTNLYINGALAHTNNVRGAYSGGTNSPLYIGCRNDVAYVFNGEMPMLKRYSRALTADEVARNYNAIKSRFNIG